MLTVFYYYHSVVHYKFLLLGQTVNKDIIWTLCVICIMYSDWRDQNCGKTTLGFCTMIMYCHTLHWLFVIPPPPQKKKLTNIVSQLLYLSYLAPCNFWIFSKLNRPLWGHRFELIKDIQAAAKKELKVITKLNYYNCFKDWKIRWNKCIISEGDYFEVKEINLQE